MDAHFAAIAADAAKRYPATSWTKKQPDDDFATLRIHTVDELTQQIERGNAQFSEFRARRHALYGALAAAMKPVEVVGQVVAGAAEDGFPATRNIFCAVMHLVRAAQDTSALYDGIISLFDQLRDFTARLHIYVQHRRPSGPLADKLTAILALVFEVVVIATQEVRRGRLRAYVNRLFGVTSPVKAALDRLHALTAGEEKLVLAETHEGVSLLSDTTERVENLVTMVNENVRSLRRLDQAGGGGRSSSLGLVVAQRPRRPFSPFPDDFYTAFTSIGFNNAAFYLFILFFFTLFAFFLSSFRF